MTVIQLPAEIIPAARLLTAAEFHRLASEYAEARINVIDFASRRRARRRRA